MGADWSFVTVGQSFTVTKGFSPTRKGGLVVPFASLRETQSWFRCRGFEGRCVFGNICLAIGNSPMDTHSWSSGWRMRMLLFSDRSTVLMLLTGAGLGVGTVKVPSHFLLASLYMMTGSSPSLWCHRAPHRASRDRHDAIALCKAE